MRRTSSSTSAGIRISIPSLVSVSMSPTRSVPASQGRPGTGRAWCHTRRRSVGPRPARHPVTGRDRRSARGEGADVSDSRDRLSARPATGRGGERSVLADVDAPCSARQRVDSPTRSRGASPILPLTYVAYLLRCTKAPEPTSAIQFRPTSRVGVRLPLGHARCVSSGPLPDAAPSPCSPMRDRTGSGRDRSAGKY